MQNIEDDLVPLTREVYDFVIENGPVSRQFIKQYLGLTSSPATG